MKPIKMKIMIVEDDEFSRNAMEKILQSYDHEALCYSQGEDAATQLEKEAFDLLLTDLHLPGMNGFELIQKAKLLQPEIHTIMMTGLVNDEVKERATVEGIDGLFSKPIVWADLLSLLDFLSGSDRIRSHAYSQVPSDTRTRPHFGGIAFAILLLLLTLLNIRYSEAQQPYYSQDRPVFRGDSRRDCLNASSIVLAEEQKRALTNLQSEYYSEAAPIRKDLMTSTFEFRYLISDPKIERKIVLDKQKKILELQSRLENLSLSYQIRARSIFTNEQVERLPWDCTLGMGAVFGIGVGIGRGPRGRVR